jgi:hypothetical protein
MASPQEPKFDPNAALREFNAYFGSLRKDYGEDAIRGAGFTPRDLSLLQASLRKLQMDPNATPEQHRQAYQQARDALAQRITTPLAAARPTPSAPPEVEVRGVRPPDVVNAPMPEVEVRGVRPTPPMPVEVSRPEMEVRGVRPVPGGNIPSVIFTGEGYMPNPAYTADVAMQRYRAELPNNNYYSPQERQQIMSSIENAYAQPGVTGEQISDAYQNASFAATRARPQVGPAAPVPSATDYISGLNGSGSNEIVASPHTAPGIMPIATQPDVILSGITPMQPPAPSMAPPMAPPMQPSMNTQPGADFDRNVARQIFDSEFRTLREKYGDEGLRAAGFTPRTLSALQAPLTNVQKDNTISYDQSSAALENALQQLRGYNFGGAQPAAAPAAPAPSMGGTLGGILGGLLPKPPTNVVDPGMNIPSDPNFRFGTTPQAPNPNAQGMAMGGLINKYYR